MHRSSQCSENEQVEADRIQEFQKSHGNLSGDDLKVKVINEKFNNTSWKKSRAKMAGKTLRRGIIAETGKRKVDEQSVMERDSKE